MHESIFDYSQEMGFFRSKNPGMEMRNAGVRFVANYNFKYNMLADVDAKNHGSAGVLHTVSFVGTIDARCLHRPQQQGHSTVPIWRMRKHLNERSASQFIIVITKNIDKVLKLTNGSMELPNKWKHVCACWPKYLHGSSQVNCVCPPM